MQRQAKLYPAMRRPQGLEAADSWLDRYTVAIELPDAPGVEAVKKEAGARCRLLLNKESAFLRRPDFVGERGQPLKDETQSWLLTHAHFAVEEALVGALAHLNAPLIDLVQIHRQTMPPTTAPPPTAQTFPEPEPQPPIPTDPSFFEFLVPGRRALREAAEIEAQREYETTHAEWRGAKAAFEAAEQARIARHEAALEGEPEPMLEVLEQVIEGMSWPLETFVSIRLHDPQTIVLDVDLPEKEMLPELVAQHIEGHPPALKLAMLEGVERQEAYRAHIHGIVFRLIGTAFATLPVVARVVASGYSQRLHESTGQIRNDHLISVEMPRATWAGINFAALEKVDPAQALTDLSSRCEAAAVPGDGSPMAPITPLRLEGGDATEAPAPFPAAVRPLSAGAVPTPSQVSAGPVALVPGANTPVDQALVQDTLTIRPTQPREGIDVVVFLLRANGAVANDADFVFFNAPRSPDGSVSLVTDASPPGVRLRLAEVPAAVARVALCVSRDTEGVNRATGAVAFEVQPSTPEGQPPITARIDAALSENAAVIGLVFYRHRDGWKLRCVGQGFKEGLAALAPYFGVEVAG